jgi:M6 family metalloprotease-like protein
MTQSPWAILLCKFNDDNSEPYPRQRYEDLFTSAGNGKFNMVDFFRDMSHGKLDLNGSQVFGWYTLDKKRSDYTGSGINQQGRADLITWARQAATDDKVDLSKFFNVVVCLNVETDLYGGDAGAVCDDGRNPDNGMTSMCRAC